MILRHISILVLILMGLWGCDKKVRYTSHDGIFWIVTESHDGYQYSYWISGGMVFAERIPYQGVAPDYSRRDMYFRTDVPSNILDPVAEWMSCKSEINPPFIPEQSFSMIRLYSSDPKLQESQTRYFTITNAKLNAWLSNLQSAICRDDYLCIEFPSWLHEDPRFRNLLGPPTK